MFAIVRPFLGAIGIIILLLFIIGVFRIEKPTYGCFHGRTLHFTERVEVLSIGVFHVYAYPLISDCPADEQYDPETVYNCGYNTFCQRDAKDE